MIDINLLPPEYAPKKLINPYNLAIIGIMTLIAISLIFSSIRLISAVQIYSDRIQYHDDQIRSYKPQVEDIRELGMKVKLLQTRLFLVQELLKEKSNLSSRLNDLYKCIPDNNIWIDNIKIEHQEEVQNTVDTTEQKAQEKPIVKDSVIFNISGTAVSVDNVSNFIANLEDSSIFNNIVFGSSIKGVKTPLGDEIMSFNFSVQAMEPKEEL